jgi:hypothetical protein
MALMPFPLERLIFFSANWARLLGKLGKASNAQRGREAFGSSALRIDSTLRTIGRRAVIAVLRFWLLAIDLVRMRFQLSRMPGAASADQLLDRLRVCPDEGRPLM